jgi:hypothetical protein
MIRQMYYLECDDIVCKNSFPANREAFPTRDECSAVAEENGWKHVLSEACVEQGWYQGIRWDEYYCPDHAKDH